MSAERVLAPFEVGDLIGRSLDGFLAVAAAHLGEAAADGSRLAWPDLAEAYLALAAVADLLDRLAPLVDEAATMPFRVGFLRLSEKLEALSAPGEDWVDRLFASFDQA